MKTRGRLAARVAAGCFFLGVVISGLLVYSISPHLTNSAELVRMRNALLLQSGSVDPAWTPSTVPAGFRLESAPPNAPYARAIESGDLVDPDDDWATALAIGRHMLHWQGQRSGGAIQSNLDETYRRITAQGEGYCGDFADVFTGLASVAGLFARAWAFSFDGFGGHGHIFNEIWDRQRQRWVMIDVFHNYYFVDSSGEPLSAMAFRQAMLGSGEGISLVLIEPDAAPGYIHEDRAWDYYRRGLPEWYLWMGNNVFEYDQNALVGFFARIHRAVEQLGGIAARVHPEIRIFEIPENKPQREAIAGLRVRLLLLVVAAIWTVLWAVGWWLLRHRAMARV